MRVLNCVKIDLVLEMELSFINIKSAGPISLCVCVCKRNRVFFNESKSYLDENKLSL